MKDEPPFEAGVALLATHANLVERQIRGDLWAILSNEVSGEQVRINETLLLIVRSMDGQRTIGSALDLAELTEHDERRSALHGLQMLLDAGLLTMATGYDSQRLIDQRTRGRRSKGMGRLRNPLAIRLPLHDPNRWLDRLTPLAGPLFSRRTLTIWCVLMSVASLSAFLNFVELGQELGSVVASPGQWWFYALLYPLLKVLHETAHAVCVRHWGGQVHEMGISLLVLMPVPYVDASDAWLFDERRHRVMCSAAGMLAELTVASVALILWCMMEPGVLRDICFSIAVLGALPTLLFNANPLMKFDGYQILQDVLDMPNLAARSSRYLGQLLKLRLFGVRSGQSSVTADGEQAWLLSYGLAALAWRWIVTFGIVIWLGTQVPLIGVMLALFSLHQLLIRPTLSGLRWLSNSPELDQMRVRSYAKAACLSLGLILFVVAVPLPSQTRTTGQVWMEGQAELLVPESGEIRQLLHADGDWVSAGEAVARLDSPHLRLQHQRKLADIALMEANRGSTLQVDAVESGILKRELRELRNELAQLTERLSRLEVRAAASGRFVANAEAALIGKRVSKGDALGHVVNRGSLRIRSVVEEAQFGRWLEGVGGINVRLAERPSEAYPAELVAVVPAADSTLPSPVLAAAKGGGVALERQASSGNEGIRTLAPVFHVELALSDSVIASGIGGRAYVTIEHEAESLARRCWRGLRQLFLEQATV